MVAESRVSAHFCRWISPMDGQESMDYMELWIGTPQNISGSSNGVREQFTVSGTSRTVGSVAVGVAWISESDPLRCW